MGRNRAWRELLSRPVKSSRLVALLLGLRVICTEDEAHAHDVPYAFGLAWQRSEAEALPVVLSNRGIIFPSTSGEAKLSIRCNEAYGVNSGAEPVLLADASGGLTVATDKQVQTSRDAACTFTTSAGLPALPLLSAVSDPTAPNRVLITSADYQSGSQVFASDDYGKSWQLRSVLRPSTSYRKLIYGSDGRVYARGNHYDEAARQLIGIWATSFDHGASFVEQPLASDREPLGVHPQIPSLVFAREPLSSALGEYPDRLLRSEDGGATFSLVRELPRITAFAATPDGAVFWLGTQTAGLYHSHDGGLHFERALEGTIESVHCLVYRQERLWLGATGVRNHEAVWMSADRGKSATSMMRLDAIASAVSCAPSGGMVCEASYQHLREELSIASTERANAEAPGIRIETNDAKASEPMPPPEPPSPVAKRQHEDGCATHGETGRGMAPWLVLLMLARATRQRRRARRDRALATLDPR